MFCVLFFFAYFFFFLFFFFNDTATTEIYTLSLHDALPISKMRSGVTAPPFVSVPEGDIGPPLRPVDVTRRSNVAAGGVVDPRSQSSPRTNRASEQYRRPSWCECRALRRPADHRCVE